MKIGNKVKVISLQQDCAVCVGDVGIIEEISPRHPFPYGCKFEIEDCLVFMAKEELKVLK